MSIPARMLLAGGLAFGALVVAVVFFWPAPATGPEPIAWGRDTCATCRMHLDRPGHAGQMRDRHGVLSTYDDIGCLVAAVVRARAEVPEAWVEDHAGGGFVPLLRAHLVRAPGIDTPMDHGVVAFADAAAAREFAAAHAGAVVTLEALLHDPTFRAGAFRDGHTWRTPSIGRAERAEVRDGDVAEDS